jgi:putative ABC transport system permease protein
VKGTFRKVSLRYFAAQRVRTAITVLGIALGVAAMVSVRFFAAALPAAYARMIEELAGKAALQVTNGDVGVGETLLDEVRAAPGVAYATGAVCGMIYRSERPSDFLSVLGVDLLDEHEMREHEAVVVKERAGDPLTFLAQPDSLAVTTQFLAETGLKVGEQMLVGAPAGIKTLTIRVALDVRSGPAKLFNGRFALMDVFAAQRLFHLEGRYSQIDVVPGKNVDVATLKARLEAVVAGRGAVERPASRGEFFDRMLAGTRYTLTAAAWGAVMVGLYLIFNTMMVAVVQRRRELGILRAVGMSRGGVMRMVIIEAFVFGVAGSALGIPLGIGLAYLLAPSVAADAARTYNTGFDWLSAGSSTASPLIWGTVFGVASAVIAAVVPAREAVRMQPMESLRPPLGTPVRSRAYSFAPVTGTVLLFLSALLRVDRDSIPLASDRLGVVLLFLDSLGILALLPGLIRVLVNVLEAPLARALGLTGTIAGRNLVRHQGRVVVTTAAFFMSLALAIFVATLLASLENTVRHTIADYFRATDLAISLLPAPAEVADQMAAMREVESLGVVRGAKAAYEGSMILIAGRGIEPADPELHRRRLEQFLLVLDGDRRDVIRRFVAGEGAIVNEAFRNRFGHKPGDNITIASPAGPAQLPILATYYDASGGNLGVVLVNLDVYRRLWRDRTVNLLEPKLKPWAHPETVAAAIRDRFGSEHPLLVFTPARYLADVERSIAAAYSTAFSLVVLAVVIALLGIANSQFACVLDRTREVGVMRAVGASRPQIARSVILESAMIGMIGGLLAAVMGSIGGAVNVDVFYRWIFSLTVFYRFPVSVVAISCPAAVALAALAGYLPARRAARQKPADALQYE